LAGDDDWRPFLIFAGEQVASGLGGVIVAMASDSETNGMDAMRSVSVLITFTIVPLAVFLAGRWAGRQARSLAWLVVILASIIAQALGTLLTFLVLSGDELAAYLQVEQVGGGDRLAVVAGAMLLGLIQGASVGLLGVWRGRRRVQEAFAVGIVRKTARADRDRLVTVIAQEAAKLAGGPAPLPPLPPTPAPTPRPMPAIPPAPALVTAPAQPPRPTIQLPPLP